MSRTIVIGDVHGCADELAELLERVAPTASDRVLLVGDLVVKGPKPGAVLAIVRQHGLESVRGNHDERLLRWRERHPDAEPKAVTERMGLAATAAQLEAEDWELLAGLPLWIEAGPLCVVHAGLDPTLPLERQSTRTLLCGRTIDDEGCVREERDGGELWGARYRGPPHVVFGHNALPEPQLHAWATGIDTGCVYGGRLTALVTAAGELPPPPEEREDALVSVRARRTYHPI